MYHIKPKKITINFNIKLKINSNIGDMNYIKPQIKW